MVPIWWVFVLLRFVGGVFVAVLPFPPEQSWTNTPLTSALLGGGGGGQAVGKSQKKRRPESRPEIRMCPAKSTADKRKKWNVKIACAISSANVNIEKELDTPSGKNGWESCYLFGPRGHCALLKRAVPPLRTLNDFPCSVASLRRCSFP